MTLGLRYIFMISLITAVVSTAFAQAKWTAESNVSEVAQNQVFNITFRLDNADGTRFTPPDLDDFDIVSGPNQSSSFQIINGRTSQSKSYNYTLLATKQGNFNIGSATIVAKGKLLKTKPLSIKVVKGSGKKMINAKSDDDFLIQMELSDTTVYIGQQITLKYMLYTNTNIHNVSFLNEPEYDGFFSQVIRNYRDRAKIVSVNGKNYTAKAIKTIALFPQQKGEFAIDDVVAKVDIRVDDGRSGFFFGTRTRSVQLPVDGVTVSVVDLPDGMPTSFSGAVGQYTMTSQIDKRNLTTDDAFTMTMKITGVGDGNFIQAPDQANNDAFEYYEPNTVADERVEMGSEIRLVKRFEYLITPKKVGTHQFTPEFSYYDVDSNKYVSLTSSTQTIVVKAGSGIADAKRIKEEQSEALNPIISNTSFSKTRAPLAMSIWHYLLYLLPVGAFLAVIIEQRKKEADARIDPLDRKQSKATAEAVNRLKVAKEYLDNGESRSFYEALYAAMNRFILDKFKIKGSEMTSSAISDRLRDSDLDDDKAEKLMSIFDQCQTGLFSGQSSESAMNTLYQKAKEVIISI